MGATLIAGCYERFLFGFQTSKNNEVGVMLCAERLTPRQSSGVAHCRPLRLPPLPGAQGAQQAQEPLGLRRIFTHAAHKGIVKCVAAAGQYAASGGADDLIHLYDLKVSC